MATDGIIRLLEESGVKVTSNRINVLRVLLEANRPMTLKELEEQLEPLDKSSIFRSLAAMREGGMLHVLEGISGVTMYEVCHRSSEGRDDDEHVHFHCDVCGTTFCLEGILMPEVDVPDGFKVTHSQYSIHGICPKCSSGR